MKVFYMGIFRYQSDKPLELCHETDLTHIRFYKDKVAALLTVAALEAAKRTEVGAQLKIKEEGRVIHVRGYESNICGVLISDEEYPLRIAQTLLGRICSAFATRYPASAISDAQQPNSMPLPELKDYIVKAQDPSKADPIFQLEQTLDETKVILYNTFDSLLERGEKLDSLIAKSDMLSAQSKMFYTQAKKQNSCCVVM
ncbi:snare-like protein [Westerdykella ornata]|uniref:Snare-like protein n=1 Tax=Westerdykella ornata TaxID=318751 RepID=A0A6A6JFU8_WESOR|nr:snare-like protein [Westerdykella ornata]KAF2274069.1 snare-like protein [Westerdykella ornata]